MTPEERAETLVTARLLRATTPVQWLVVALTVLAGGRLLFGQASIGAVAAIVAGVVAALYGVRIALDARLLEDVAAGTMSTEDLDKALAAFGKSADRSWGDRCRGSRRLVLSFTTATTAQVVAVVVAGWA